MNEYDLAVALKDEHLMLKAKQEGTQVALEKLCRKLARKLFNNADIFIDSPFSITFNTGEKLYQFRSFDITYYDDFQVWCIATSINADGSLSKHGGQRVHCIWNGEIPRVLPSYIKSSKVEIKEPKASCKKEAICQT